MEVRVELERLPWEAPSRGIRFKVFRRAGQQIRLLELSDGFEEEGWCTRAHAFHVLEGELSLRLRDGTVRLKAGDVGFLEGEAAPHKAMVGPGESVRLLLFERA